MAVTIDKAINKKNEGNLTAFPVKSGETIYTNTLVGIDGAGYLVNLTASNLTGIKLVGVVADDSANSKPAATGANGSISGSMQEASVVNGDKTVRRVWLSGQFELAATSITQAMVGQTMFAVDNFTFDDTLSSLKIGTLVTYISSTKGWVDLNRFANADGFQTIKGSLTAVTGTTGGGIVNLLNPFGYDVLVEDVILNIGTGSTGAATGDFGLAATGTSSDILLDGVNMQTTGYQTIGVNGGTNGKYGRIWTSTNYLTGTASATLAGLVGTYEVIVRKI